MLKALIKKQFREVISGYTVNKKTGKKRSAGATVGLVVLFIFIFASVGFAYYGMGLFFATTFIEQGLSWLYFAVMGLMAIFLGALLDTFSAYSTIYCAKDNDLLLSMPIKPSRILLSRMFSLFVMGLIFECMVFIPAFLAYITVSSITSLGVTLFVISTILIAVAVTALSCIFGYVVALIGSVFKNKAFISIFSTILILLVYYVIYFRMNDLLQGIATHAQGIANTIKTYLYPMYCLGMGCTGDLVNFLIFAIITVVIFAAVCAVLSLGFIKIATRKTDQKGGLSSKKSIQSKSPESALLKKEFKHFWSSMAYMMNCGLSLAILLFATVMVIIKSGDINSGLDLIFKAAPAAAPFIQGLLAPAVAAATVLVCSMSAITSPSISLEGNNLWILRASPIPPIKVLYSKLKLHLILTEIPACLFVIAAIIVLKLPVLDAALLLLTVFSLVLILGYLGLIFNLKHPKLEWTNETVPVKQSMSVLFCMLSGFAMAVVYGGLLLLSLIYLNISTTLYMGITVIILAGICILLDRRLKTKGAELFDNL